MINVILNKRHYRLDNNSLPQNMAATIAISSLCFLTQFCSKSALGLRDVGVKPKDSGNDFLGCKLDKKHHDNGCSQWNNRLSTSYSQDLRKGETDNIIYMKSVHASINEGLYLFSFSPRMQSCRSCGSWLIMYGVSWLIVSREGNFQACVAMTMLCLAHPTSHLYWWLTDQFS